MSYAVARCIRAPVPCELISIAYAVGMRVAPQSRLAAIVASLSAATRACFVRRQEQHRSSFYGNVTCLDTSTVQAPRTIDQILRMIPRSPACMMPADLCSKEVSPLARNIRFISVITTPFLCTDHSFSSYPYLSVFILPFVIYHASFSLSLAASSL